MTVAMIEGICIVCYEAICCKNFLDIFMKKKKGVGNFAIPVVLAVAFMLFATITQYTQSYFVRSLLIIATIIVVTEVFYSGKWILKVFLSASFYGLLSCMDYIGIILAGELLDPTMLENAAVQIIVVLMCKTVLFLLILLLRKVWQKRTDTSRMNNSEWILLFSFPIVTVASMLFLLYSYQIGSSTVGYLAVSFGMVIANLILFLLLQYVSVKENEWYQVQMLHKQNKEKMQAYRESNVNYEFLKRMMHDYGNQLNCIQGLLQQKRFEQAREYTEKLTNSFHEEMNVVNVHHPIINVLLNQKYHLAEEKGISVIFQLNDLSDVWMEEQDLVVLLSNLLDNAIEASEKCDEKIIWVKIVLESQQMIVSVKNSVEKNVDIQDDLIHTTKRDAVNHGIGLKNIRLVLQKYHALGSMTCHDGYFWYTAVIPRGIQE